MDITDLDKDRQQTITAQYEAVRRSGKTNMLIQNEVQRIAFDNEMYELVSFIEDGGYSFILSNYEELIENVDDSKVATIS